ncbi:MAG: hypothetical protein IKY17_06615, partial [Oscillospiraceae bacterium]|nr:hypothetical protein [Oscillospiraceae bacterium]
IIAGWRQDVNIVSEFLFVFCAKSHFLFDSTKRLRPFCIFCPVNSNYIFTIFSSLKNVTKSPA